MVNKIQWQDSLDASGSIYLTPAQSLNSYWQLRVKFNNSASDYETTPLSITIDALNATLAVKITVKA